jgi:protein-disulfide isomerase
MALFELISNSVPDIKHEHNAIISIVFKSNFYLFLIAPLLLLALVILGWFIFGGANYIETNTAITKINNNDDGSGRPQIKGSDTQLIIGNPSAPITLVEYIDFKCPTCNDFHRSVLGEIRSKDVEKGKVKIDVRAYPFLAPDSGRALKGAYCANAQALFTDYHDAVFTYMWETYYKKGDIRKEYEDVLSKEVLASIISNSGGDKNEFLQCLESKALDVQVDNDLVLAANDEIQGTPSFVIGDQKITGPQPYNVFRTLFNL